MSMSNRPKSGRAFAVAGALLAGLMGGLVTAAPHATAAMPYCNAAWEKTSLPHPSTSYASIPLYDTASGSGTTDCVMAQGSSGAGVRALQKSLNGCYGAGLALDGAFGAATREALRSAQSRMGAVADGEYGPETRGKMSWGWYSIETGARVKCARL
ncbi:peptidoglycan-binding protein [Streptomyces sp. GMY02]|uniref:peptidoglycan-binding domain-containing protein n=1 Tax=Streptomyces sp. GMY02 TaxID=1333528 RepID=UPI001C2C4786|nr:peptidoglycan-binding domain-containing protein [Streptomyces sp. GMY02]QXE35783.1 peptidoglycan-binding protein [Streptomyces sp. GMY02]